MIRRLLIIGVALTYSIGVIAAPANPLRILTHTEWPNNITNVGNAARWILTPTGYRLANTSLTAPDSVSILARPIASAALRPQTLAIEDALLAIAGADTVLYVDHEHKLVAFGYRNKEAR